VTEALARLQALADPERAARDRAYHKVERPYLGVPVPALAPLVAEWRVLALADRMALARGLWRTNIHEARVAAAKLMIQARIRPDDGPVWDLLLSWLPDFDAWAIADVATSALQRRLAADPSRIAVVEGWTTDPNLWVRRAALVIAQPFVRLPFPKAPDLAIRDRALVWAEAYLPDRQWFIHKAIGALLRDLSVRDPARTRAFLAAHGAALMPVARAEARRRLTG
jgi:3-methyladenine DNA glycosylase AlkD